MFSLITRAARAPYSTSSTCSAPRDRASRPTAPDPAYRSSTRFPASEPAMEATVANKPSLARSLVGRVSRPFGTASRRPPRRRSRVPPPKCARPGPSRGRVLDHEGLYPFPGGKSLRSAGATEAAVTLGLVQVFGLDAEEFLDRLAQRRVPGQVRVGRDDRAGLLPGPPDQVLVGQQPEQPQAGLPAGLRGPEHVAFPALLQVEPGQLEPVEGGRDRLEPLPRRAGRRRLAHQQA